MQAAIRPSDLHAPGFARSQQDSRARTRYKRGKKTEGRMIYETRVYRCLPGRLPALLKRFETVP